ncbi:hypothetical protein [Undibacterium sp. TJN19]|uniref:hypothetical protein n=1 Tax=Undibacterium sp. TJN19 TaxID=3413055 RepID=UPI003BF2811D
MFFFTLAGLCFFGHSIAQDKIIIDHAKPIAAKFRMSAAEFKISYLAYNEMIKFLNKNSEDIEDAYRHIDNHDVDIVIKKSSYEVIFYRHAWNGLAAM